MKKEKSEQESAFTAMQINERANVVYKGLSKREYAAIELGVPDSGEEWLDDMIRKSNRFKAACFAMKGILSGVYSGTDTWLCYEEEASKKGLTFDELLSIQSIDSADELLKQQ